jgi:hypothetical protein
VLLSVERWPRSRTATDTSKSRSGADAGARDPRRITPGPVAAQSRGANPSARLKSKPTTQGGVLREKTEPANRKRGSSVAGRRHGRRDSKGKSTTGQRRRADGSPRLDRSEPGPAAARHEENRQRCSGQMKSEADAETWCGAARLRAMNQSRQP